MTALAVRWLSNERLLALLFHGTPQDQEIEDEAKRRGLLVTLTEPAEEREDA